MMTEFHQWTEGPATPYGGSYPALNAGACCAPAYAPPLPPWPEHPEAAAGGPPWPLRPLNAPRPTTMDVPPWHMFAPCRACDERNPLAIARPATEEDLQRWMAWLDETEAFGANRARVAFSAFAACLLPSEADAAPLPPAKARR